MDFHFGIRSHLAPIRDPSRHPADGEHHREHVHRDADRAENNAAVEIDVGIEFAGDEIVVRQRGLLELLGDVEQRILDPHRGEDALGRLAQDARTRVVVFVNAVAEAHEAALAFLGGFDRFVSVIPGGLDVLEHFDDCRIGSAVKRAPERTHPGRNTGKEVGPARRDHAHGGSTAVLLVIGVEQKNEIERIDDFRLRIVVPIRLGEHHVQEIGRVAEVPARVDKRQAALGAVGHGREGANFGNEQSGSPVEMPLVQLLFVGSHLGVIAAERVEHGGENGHGMRRVRESLEEDAHAFVDRGTGGNAGAKFGELARVRQFAVNDQECGLQKDRFGRQILDAVAAMPQDPLLPVDESDAAAARPRVGIAIVISDEAGLVAERTHVHRLFLLRADNHR